MHGGGDPAAVADRGHIPTGLVLVALAPQLSASAEQARRWLTGQPADLSVGDLIFPPIVSPTAPLIAMILAVVKPWSPVRRRTQ